LRYEIKHVSKETGVIFWVKTFLPVSFINSTTTSARNDVIHCFRDFVHLYLWRVWVVYDVNNRLAWRHNTIHTVCEIKFVFGNFFNLFSCRLAGILGNNKKKVAPTNSGLHRRKRVYSWLIAWTCSGVEKWKVCQDRAATYLRICGLDYSRACSCL
jgi:hypothetical protein